jgi:hypothetical protein
MEVAVEFRDSELVRPVLRLSNLGVGLPKASLIAVSVGADL